MRRDGEAIGAAEQVPPYGRFDEAFRAAVLGQHEAFAKGAPQGIMAGFLKRRGGGVGEAQFVEPCVGPP